MRFFYMFSRIYFYLGIKTNRHKTQDTRQDYHVVLSLSSIKDLILYYNYFLTSLF
jgi:hypothetical protein